MLIANKLSMDLGLHLSKCTQITQASIQVTQSRRGYIHESSGSALVMFFSAVSHRCSFQNLALHSGRQNSIMQSLGSCPFSSIDFIVLVCYAMMSTNYTIQYTIYEPGTICNKVIRLKLFIQETQGIVPNFWSLLDHICW